MVAQQLARLLHLAAELVEREILDLGRVGVDLPAGRVLVAPLRADGRPGPGEMPRPASHEDRNSLGQPVRAGGVEVAHAVRVGRVQHLVRARLERLAPSGRRRRRRRGRGSGSRAGRAPRVRGRRRPRSGGLAGRDRPAPGAQLARHAARRLDDRGRRLRAPARAAGSARCRRRCRSPRPPGRRGRRSARRRSTRPAPPRRARARRRARGPRPAPSRSALGASVRAVSLGSGSATRSSSDLVARVRQDRLAQRAGVHRQLRADLEHLEGRVGPEDVVHDDDARPVQHADAAQRPASVPPAARRGRSSGRAARSGPGTSCRAGAARRRAGTCRTRGPARRTRAPGASGAGRARSGASSQAVGQLADAQAPRTRRPAPSECAPRGRPTGSSRARVRSSASVPAQPLACYSALSNPFRECRLAPKPDERRSPWSGS